MWITEGCTLLNSDLGKGFIVVYVLVNVYLSTQF